MAKKTYTVKTFTQTAVPRAARLRGVTAAVGRSSAVVSGSGADHSHPNQRFLETLGDDIAATEDAAPPHGVSTSAPTAVLTSSTTPTPAA